MNQPDPCRLSLVQIHQVLCRRTYSAGVAQDHQLRRRLPVLAMSYNHGQTFAVMAPCDNVQSSPSLCVHLEYNHDRRRLLPPKPSRPPLQQQHSDHDHCSMVCNTASEQHLRGPCVPALCAWEHPRDLVAAVVTSN